MAIHFLGNIGAVDSTWPDTDIVNCGGLELFDHSFGNLATLDEAATWSGGTPATIYQMRDGSLDEWDTDSPLTRNVRYYIMKWTLNNQSTAQYPVRFWWSKNNIVAGAGADTGTVALYLLTDPGNDQYYIRAQYWDGAAWQNGTLSAAIDDDPGTATLRIVVKVDLSDTGGDQPTVEVLHGDGNGVAMTSLGPDNMVGVTIAEAKAATTPECSVGFDPAVGKNQGAGFGLHDYIPAEAIDTDGWDGYEWTTTKEQRAWERTPTGDGDDDGSWTLVGHDANCPNAAWRTMDDPLDNDDQGNDYITTSTQNHLQLFTYQVLDGADDPDGVSVAIITANHAESGDYEVHWKDSGGTSRQKALVKGYENGANGTILHAWLATQAGTAGVSDWTQDNFEGAQFGVKYVGTGTAKVYGYQVFALGDSFGDQVKASACPAPTGHVRQGVSFGSANAMHFKADLEEEYLLQLPVGGCCS